MNKTARSIVIALFAGLVSVTAYAAEPVATLRVDGGSVMTSAGGDFVTAATGQPLQAGERLMVTDGGSATVLCGTVTRTYDTPGVYVIEGCGAGAQAAGGTDWAAALQISAAAVVGAAVLESQGSSRSPPVSR